MGDRTLELTLVHKANAMSDFASPWVPRLTIVARGTTARLDLAQPALADQVRFGARGVCVGAPHDQPAAEGDAKMHWRFLAHEEVVGLIAAVEPLLGAPEVKGVADTGDWFQTAIVSGAVDDKPFYLRVGFMQAGFKGSHAAAFATLMRRLLAVANLDPEDALWSTLTIVK